MDWVKGGSMVYRLGNEFRGEVRGVLASMREVARVVWGVFVSLSDGLLSVLYVGQAMSVGLATPCRMHASIRHPGPESLR